MANVVVDREVLNALGPLAPALVDRGFELRQSSAPPAFDNFEVVVSCGSFNFTVVRDRGQFFVGGAEQAELEPAGLWQMFSGSKSLSIPLLAWLESKRAV